MNTFTITLEDQNDFLVYRKGSGRSAEIYDIAVGSSRREGKGRKLVELLLEKVSSETSLVFAITRISNVPAQQFYEALGFRIIGRLHNFYRDGGITAHTESAIMYGLDV